MPPRYPSSADTHAMVARIAPSILELLGDGIPRNKRTIIAALADKGAKPGLATSRPTQGF